MDRLKLFALDVEDLATLSAHAQDAVVRVEDLRWLPGERRFLMVMNRFVWEKRGGVDERRRSVLAFDRVEAVKAAGIPRQAPEAVMSLLAVTFEPSPVEAEAPAGTVVAAFAGGGTLRIAVECIEARLGDVGGAWAARGRPLHDADE